MLVMLGRSGRTLYPHKLGKAIQKIKVPFFEIWVVGLVSDNMNKVHLVRIYPSVSDHGFDVNDALAKAKNQKDVLQKLKRGKSTAMRDLGKVYMPIP
jgi:hypothetical protein